MPITFSVTGEQFMPQILIEYLYKRTHCPVIVHYKKKKKAQDGMQQ